MYATNIADSDFTLPVAESDTFIGKVVSNERVPTERYVCGACGYFETYVADRALLRKIAESKTWIKI